MGSTCEANGKVIDPTVGGLVWVRRRNGSWWPGRILGPDELPESCLVSPRSGTPVKLLGREDASVDWYNLEKSKRVKAFRCGEYDECIEKAKVTATISCKKAVKYARREDAILHALELESSRLSKQPDSKQPDEEEETEAMSDKLSGLEYVSSSPQELSRTAASVDNSLEDSKQRTPNDSEDDGSKKRMRGLEDIGLGRTKSIKRRKRSLVAHAHDCLKKKNRRRQLTKVLKSTASMVSVPVMCDVPVTCEKVNTLTESKRSFTDSNGDVVNNANCKQKENEISSVSELLFDVPFIGEEKQTAGSSLGLVPEKARVGGGAQSGQSSLVETVSVGPDEIQESGSISSGAAGMNDISHSIDNNGTSKWQHKGKRNSRNKSKTVHKIIETNAPDEQLTKSDTATQKLLPYRHSRFNIYPKYESLDLANRNQDSGSLYDVNIEVQVGHFPHHVPYISLLSKSTGQTITGHSLVVEVLNRPVSLNGPECGTSLALDGVNGNVGKNPRRNGNGSGLLSNKKTRRLSTLTGFKRPSETGKLKLPGLACVPLKVVFSRINAALGISPVNNNNR